MKINSRSLFLSAILITTIGSNVSASVRMSSGINQFSPRATYSTSAGWALPAGDWTLGIWDNNFQGDGGVLINGPINLCYDAAKGRFYVGGKDAEGTAFGSGGTAMVNDVTGILPAGYPGRVTGKFTPRLHIIRRNAGKSEYLVAEAGHAPVLVCSEARTFGATAVHNWSLACLSGWADLYDADLEGFFFATAAVSNKDIALMAAGAKPSSALSISTNLTVYFPLETASLSNTSNPLLLTNQGSATTVGLKRLGGVSLFADGPMLRGATSENNTPSQVTEPTNVVALNSFQPFQIIRHLNGSANVSFTGFDYGVGTADLEIRFTDVEHSTSTAWQTLLLGSTGGGAPIQATIPVPKGYWKTIEVRRVNSAGGTGNSSRPNRTWSRWAVGEVVVVWGDSIQGQVDGASRANLVPPNGFTAKYPSAYPNTLDNDKNPLSYGMWNLLRGGGMGGGSQGENEIVNNLSAASQCCVGITVSWSGATRLAYWNGRLDSAPYTTAKSYCLANGGLNKPNVITWVGNLASANSFDDFYADLNRFKSVLDADFGGGTWQLILAPVPIVYNGSGGTPVGFQMLRDSCQRWVKDNPQIGQFAGVSMDHLTYDGVHPNDAAWNLMGPRWGNAAGYLRDKQNYADPRAGEIVNFYRSAGNVIVEVQLFAGTALSLKNSATNISGLTLSSDNFATTIPIASAVLINGTSFRITPVSPLPAGPLKLRYLYGKPGTSGNTLAQQGVDNLLYVNAGPTNILAVLPIWGAASNNWSLAEGSGTPPPPGPEVSVAGNAVTIADGDATPGSADKTDFGGVDVASGSATVTFTILNQGTQALTVNTVAVSGTNALDFAVVTQPATSVAAGGSTTFSVRFDPSASGVRTANLSFGNNDTDENPYNFAVQGNGGVVAADVIVDNSASTGVAITGAWTASSSVLGYYGGNYIHDGNTGQGAKSVRFTPTLPASGTYEVFARWTADVNRATNVPIDITGPSGTVPVEVNQQQDGGEWVSLGIYFFNSGTAGSVLISNTAANGHVIVDAVRFLLRPSVVTNADFESDASGSQSISGWSESGAVTASVVSSTVAAQSGSKYLGIYQSSGYTEFTFQTMSGLPNGLYTLKAWSQRSTAGYTAQMEATPGGGTTVAVALPVNNTAWTQQVITNVNVTDGSCVVGFRSTAAPAGAALRIDSVEFYRQ